MFFHKSPDQRPAYMAKEPRVHSKRDLEREAGTSVRGCLSLSCPSFAAELCCGERFEIRA